MLLFCVIGVSAQDYPAWCSTTTHLNIRASDSQYGRKIDTVLPGTMLKVVSIGSNGWAEIEYNGMTAYCAVRYLNYVEPVTKVEIPQQPKENRGSTFSWWDVVGVLFYVFLGCLLIGWIRKGLLYVLGLAAIIFYKLYLLISLPFYFLNWLQRLLSKPWFLFYKHNSRTDTENKDLREMLELCKIPLYILLTPLRFVNAFYYNIVVHCSFELFNYLLEVVEPVKESEGGDDNFIFWLIMIPWRILKYMIIHAGLTLIESCFWTVVDTFIPTLTLYHGTTPEAAESITQGPGRVCSKGWYSGVWNVGGGNYAGNGIYFAPKRKTAIHYSRGSLIVARVSLGRTLDLGMAPRRIYNLCGYPNALGVTEWGLKNGYVTGEWWRGDSRAGWWEYCMYDWQNRYNESWRIRPLYVINLSDEIIQRVPGGMVHWLFSKMVFEDMLNSIEKKLD